MGLFGSIGSILGSVGSAVGAISGNPLVSAGANILGGVLTNNSAKQQAQDQMAFQADQSNTSYQRAVTDMRAAGLNPMLAYSQGGASTPSGASAPISNPAPAAVSSALQAHLQNATLQNTQAQTDKIKAETDAIRTTLPNKTILNLPAKALERVIDRGAHLVAPTPNSSPSSAHSPRPDNAPRYFAPSSDASPASKAFFNRVMDSIHQRSSSSAKSLNRPYLLPPPVNFK